MNKLGLLALTTSLLVTTLNMTPALAQQVNPKARQKASWYNSPREIQIVDERPVVRDFREAPTAPPPIDLPPGPGSRPGAYGGGGAGAMGGPGQTIPSEGIPIGGPNQGYKTPVETSPVPLDKADFGHRASNIPSGGIGPKGPLPGGFTTGIHGKVAPPNYPTGQMANAGRAPRRDGPGQAVPATPTLMNTSPAGYEHGVGTSAGNGGASTKVIGRLLNKVK